MPFTNGEERTRHYEQIANKNQKLIYTLSQIKQFLEDQGVPLVSDEVYDGEIESLRAEVASLKEENYKLYENHKIAMSRIAILEAERDRLKKRGK